MLSRIRHPYLDEKHGQPIAVYSPCVGVSHRMKGRANREIL